jgi:hypothetical protein
MLHQGHRIKNFSLHGAYYLCFEQILYYFISRENFQQLSCWTHFSLTLSSCRIRRIFIIFAADRFQENSKYCHIERFSSIFIFFLHNKVLNKNLSTFATISRLVPINIIKLQNNKHVSTINYKVHVCILHASTSPSLTHARPRVWRW